MTPENWVYFGSGFVPGFVIGWKLRKLIAKWTTK